jgi:hypothetical protein
MNQEMNQQPDAMPMMTVPRGVALPLGGLQVLVLVVAVAVACVVLWRRQPPGDAEPGEPGDR